MAKHSEDIPRRDDDFYTFTRDIIEILEEVTEMGGITQENWKHWRIPESDFKNLKENFLKYEKRYLRAQKKKDRTQSDVAVHRSKRKKMEPLIRQFIKEHLRYESIIPEGEKVRMALITIDSEPSPVHGSHLSTGAPVVSLKNMGGAMVDARFRKTAAQKRGSVPKGYGCELRYVLEIPLPDDPEDIPGKTTVLSSKARFQISAGMTNKKKTMRSYARWRHKTNPQLNSPWTEVMEIDIA